MRSLARSLWVGVGLAPALLFVLFVLAGMLHLSGASGQASKAANGVRPKTPTHTPQSP